MVKFDGCGRTGEMSIYVDETDNKTDKEEEVEYDIDRIRKIEELRKVLQRALGSTRYPLSTCQERTAPTETLRDYRPSAPQHAPSFPVRPGGPRRGRDDGRSRAKITERPRNVAVCTVDGGVTLFQRVGNDEMETAM